MKRLKDEEQQHAPLAHLELERKNIFNSMCVNVGLKKNDLGKFEVYYGCHNSKADNSKASLSAASVASFGGPGYGNGFGEDTLFDPPALDHTGSYPLLQFITLDKETLQIWSSKEGKSEDKGEDPLTTGKSQTPNAQPTGATRVQQQTIQTIGATGKTIKSENGESVSRISGETWEILQLMMADSPDLKRQLVSQLVSQSSSLAQGDFMYGDAANAAKEHNQKEHNQGQDKGESNASNANAEAKLWERWVDGFATLVFGHSGGTTFQCVLIPLIYYRIDLLFIILLCVFGFSDLLERIAGEIVAEKRKGLQGYLMVLGVSPRMYVAHYAFTGVFYNVDFLIGVMFIFTAFGLLNSGEYDFGTSKKWTLS